MNNEQFCAKFYVDRKNTSCLKWDSLHDVFGREDLLPLWVADMDFSTAPEIVAAMQERLDHGVFGYGKVEDSYYEAYASWQGRNGVECIKKENVRFAPGVVSTLYDTVNAFTKSKESVLICPPVYYPFYDAVLNTGRNLVLCDLDNHDGNYTLDMDKFEKSIKENDVKLFIFCSPHNPVGRVWTHEELNSILSICKNNSVIVLSDEIHQDFVNEKIGAKFISSAAASSAAYRDILIVANSVSKSFNLAGTNHSHVLIFNEELLNQYDAYIKSRGASDANILGVISSEAAFRHGAEWQKQLRDVIYSNYELAVSEFRAKAPKIIISPLEGTYLMWVDLRGYFTPEEVGKIMMERCNLAVDVGEWFSYTGHGFVRVNLATSPANIQTAINSILSEIV